MKIIEILSNRVIIFTIQILLLNILFYIIGNEFIINFDDKTTKAQEFIIQYLANLTLFDNLQGFYFIYLSWLLISLIPIFLFNNFKNATSMNLLTLFFPNFFFYVFLEKKSKLYFKSNFFPLLGQSVILGIVIIGFSIFLSLLLKKLKKIEIESLIEDLFILTNNIKTKCPKCGTLFDSNPQFCFNCNTDLAMLGNNEEKEKK